MTRVGITGSDGFLGWHLRCALHADDAVSVTGANRETFADQVRLEQFVAGCDALVHLAGMNRGDDHALEATNIGLTRQVIAACTATGARPHVIFASSTHQQRDTAYGRSKRACAAILGEWAAGCGATFINLVLPQVFGECGRPFYNSVVATFCHQLANGEQPRVIEDAELELVHAQQVAQKIRGLVARPVARELRLAGRLLTVSALLDTLHGIAGEYARQVIPRLGGRLDAELFNTYRSYLFPARYPVALALREDARGRLFEAVKSLGGGQCFISTTRPGVTRGNHYHRSKFERFLVLAGEAVIKVRRLFAADVTEYRVSGDNPRYVDLPTLHTHNITNVGAGELTTLFWSNEIFDSGKPDTYAEQV